MNPKETSVDALRRAQAILAPYLVSGPDLVDELIELRRRESRGTGDARAEGGS